jgi:lysophospholipase L1-like esterase
LNNSHPSKEKICPYIITKKDSNTPFNEIIIPNQETVELKSSQVSNRYVFRQYGGMFEGIKDFGRDSLNWLVRNSRNNDFLNDKREKEIIIMEGDSWFLHPAPWVTDLYDSLISEYRIKCLAGGGDEFRDIIKKKDYVQTIKNFNRERINIKAFLISAGGNDTLGNIVNLVDRKNKKINYGALVNQVKLLEIMFKELIQDIRGISPELKIIAHTYDYGNPLIPNGDWIGSPLSQIGFNMPQIKSVVKTIMDAFYEMLNTLHKQEHKFDVIDNRGTVTANSVNWYDEIHPTKNGYQVLTNRFIAKI